jgi:hypothetical protein
MKRNPITLVGSAHQRSWPMAMDNKPPLSRRPVICGAAIAPAGSATSLAPSIAQEVYGSAGGSGQP